MAEPSDDQRLELLQGTLDMLVLRTLQWGPQHGHGIGQAIRAQSDDLLKVETGSLYPALHRLEKRGWLKSEWGVSEANQRAKYYQLTAAGKAQLSRERDRWSQMVNAIGRIMNPSPAEGLVPWKRDDSHNSRAGHPASRRCSSLTYAQYARSSRLAIRAPRSGTYASHHASRGLANAA